MKKITGITAEYNPLHNGHVHQLEQARLLSGCDAVVTAMSGDFVQRGEPAILDKWTRCSLALDAGADLVVEIPVLFCLGNAAQYASASVSLLEALGCDSISFGSECADAEMIRKVADRLRDEKESIGPMIAAFTKEGLSYPAARSKAYKAIFEDDAETGKELGILSSPNDILALEYVMNMKTAQPLCVERKGALHGASLDENAEYQSAGAIRNALRNGAAPEDLKQFIPVCTYEALAARRQVFPDDLADILRYAVSRTPEDVIEDCPSAGEGLGNLIKRSARENASWDAIVLGAKSKRYTYTRISRLCMQVILGIQRSRLALTKPGYIRVLGFSEKGREILSAIRKEDSCPLPVITNINKEASALSGQASAMLGLDVFAADLYNRISGLDNERSDHVMRPVMK